MDHQMQLPNRAELKELLSRELKYDSKPMLRALEASKRIERIAGNQSEALAVILGSQGNAGTQLGLNQIAADARTIQEFLSNPMNAKETT